MFFTFKFKFSCFIEPKACPDTVQRYGRGDSSYAQEYAGTVSEEDVEECMALVLENFPDADALSIEIDRDCFAEYNVQGTDSSTSAVMCLLPSKHLITFYNRVYVYDTKRGKL